MSGVNMSMVANSLTERFKYFVPVVLLDSFLVFRLGVVGPSCATINMAMMIMPTTATIMLLIKRRRRPLRRASLMRSAAGSDRSKITSCRGGEIVTVPLCEYGTEFGESLLSNHAHDFAIAHIDYCHRSSLPAIDVENVDKVTFDRHSIRTVEALWVKFRIDNSNERPVRRVEFGDRIATILDPNAIPADIHRASDAQVISARLNDANQRTTFCIQLNN